MRVLLVAEKEGTAIARLAIAQTKAAPWHSYRIVYVHPKRPSLEQLNTFEEALHWCDVIDFRYWRTAEVLRAHFDIRKPCMLTHYNPYDLNRQQWSEYNQNIVVNREQQSLMKHAAQLIPLPIDLDFWEYKKFDHVPAHDIIMVANRIEAKKGILPVAKLAGQKGYSMLLVGSISDPAYMAEVEAAAGGRLTYQSGITDEQLRDRYYTSRVHICNSIDNFESGTMPILESMACGTPVITRRVGHVPDIFNGRNMVVRKSTVEDINELDAMITDVINDKTIADELSREGRASLRSRSLEIYGRQYSKLYHKLLQPENLVSVVIPTVAGPDDLVKTLAHVMAQTAEDMEIIVCDDSEDPRMNAAMIDVLRASTKRTIKFYATATYVPAERTEDPPWPLFKTYGLARARNKAILEAEGEWIMLVDDRLHVAPDALAKFMEHAREGTWLWGVKDGSPKSFVENFSMVKRSDIIKIGGFNEQISQYGGMTQEVRTRAELNGLKLELVSDARATAAYKSRSKWSKHQAIAKSKAQCYKLYG